MRAGERQREGESEAEKKQKATGEEERQANRRIYKLQMIAQNTHYLSVASLLPPGTRSGNSQSKGREREKRGGEKERKKHSYLGRKALQALEKEFRT